jgi:acetylornithine/succinyldiaminopimelate/putrescine aminotransferase
MHVVNTNNNQSLLACLDEMKNSGGAALTRGLTDTVILDFLEDGPELAVAIERAYANFLELKKTHAEFVALEESEQIKTAQAGLTNFYSQDTVNPYVAVSGAGPWIVSLKGAVIYDCGGYGMLGLGHAPQSVLDAMNKPHVMANVMTANVSQLEFVKALKRVIGHTRPGGTPYASFVCLNSGSESMSVASRITDVNVKLLTDPGCRYEDYRVCGLTLKGSFHGRTDRPARFSDSTRGNYEKHLASFRESDYLITVEPNNIAALESAFERAQEEKIFIEAFFMEPVMGEGNPGMAIEPEFYKRARELTRQYGSMFVVDSIQAGLRAHGVLSIVDYPGFEDLEAPDMETYSKALNAGQYPLSVLALSEQAAATYKQGLYGNTMTTNPRCLDVALAVLESFTPELRDNIRARGKQLVQRLAALAEETNNAVTRAQGTGLLLSCELDERYKVYGANSVEDYLRKIGLSVIHGGKRSLRYTPVFNISEKEVDLVVSLTREALLKGPQAS